MAQICNSHFRIEKRSTFLWVLLFVSFAALALGLSIDARQPPYNSLSNVQGTTIHSDWEIRNAGLTQIAAAYRLIHGLSTLQTGSVFRVTWGGGSSEGASVVSAFSSLGAVPIPDTQTECSHDCEINSPSTKPGGN